MPFQLRPPPTTSVVVSGSLLVALMGINTTVCACACMRKKQHQVGLKATTCATSLQMAASRRTSPPSLQLAQFGGGLKYTHTPPIFTRLTRQAAAQVAAASHCGPIPSKHCPWNHIHQSTHMHCSNRSEACKCMCGRLQCACEWQGWAKTTGQKPTHKAGTKHSQLGTLDTLHLCQSSKDLFLCRHARPPCQLGHAVAGRALQLCPDMWPHHAHTHTLLYITPSLLLFLVSTLVSAPSVLCP